MNYIDIHSDKFIILSFGRTGSILLCKNIEKNFRKNPKYQTNDPNLIPTMKAIKIHGDLGIVNPVTILNCHLFFSTQQLNGYQRIFSVRKNYVEQILSTYFAHKFNKFHLQAEDSAMHIEEFELQDWNELKSICKYCVDWYQYYLATLGADDLVVVYEDFVKKLKPDQIQKPIYPDKEKYIKNYEQVKNFIDSNMIENKNLSDKFINHSNKFDIYKYII
jgi:hypothetical protein